MDTAVKQLTRRAFVRMASLSSLGTLLGPACQAAPTEAPPEDKPTATATTAPTSTPTQEPTRVQEPTAGPTAAAVPRVRSEGVVSVEWLGHGSFKFDSPAGKVVLLDPWLETNPSCPPAYRTLDGFSQVDLVLFTHGHVDHFMLPDVKGIIERFNPKIVAPWELEFFLKAEVPLADTLTFNLANKGATSIIDGLGVTMVGADHSSGAQLNGFEGVNKYVGEPCGYIIEFENGFSIYHSGDTGLMADMELVVGNFYAPDLAILPIGGVFTMGPREAAYACKLIRPQFVIPEHYGTFPVLTQTADEFVQSVQQYAPETQVSVLEPGGSVQMPPAAS